MGSGGNDVSASGETGLLRKIRVKLFTHEDRGNFHKTLPEELVERCLAFVTPRDRLNIFGAASRVAMRAAREPRWFLPRASRLSRKLNSQLRAQMALVNEQMTVVSDSQARVRHFETCLRSVERKLDDRRREFRAHREKPLAAAVRRRALFSKRGARELVDVARAALSTDVDITQPYDAYYDGVVNCVEINQCVGCTKSFLGDDAAVLAPSSR